MNRVYIEQKTLFISSAIIFNLRKAIFVKLWIFSHLHCIDFQTVSRGIFFENFYYGYEDPKHTPSLLVQCRNPIVKGSGRYLDTPAIFQKITIYEGNNRLKVH